MGVHPLLRTYSVLPRSRLRSWRACDRGSLTPLKPGLLLSKVRGLQPTVPCAKKATSTSIELWRARRKIFAAGFEPETVFCLIGHGTDVRSGATELGCARASRWRVARTAAPSKAHIASASHSCHVKCPGIQGRTFTEIITVVTNRPKMAAARSSPR